MSDKKNSENPKGQPEKAENFDDLEDAFFASGDASSFWETADPKQLDDESEVGTPDVDPLNEDSESIVPPEPAAVATAEAGEHQEEDEDVIVEAAPATPPTPPRASGSLLGETGEFYNPSALHPAPDLIADEETEVWSEPEVADAMASAATVIHEPDDEPQAPRLDEASAPTIISEAEPDTGIKADQVDFNGPYTPPSSPEAGWREGADALLLASASAPSLKASLLSESARILLLRAGDWEEAGKRFAQAIQAGLDPLDTPKGYADVVASNGDFGSLRDLLVARARSLSGPAAVEALQDAAIVERTHLNNDAAAVSLLEEALQIRDDWFTLRLLRELHYRSQAWEKLLNVLERMVTLCGGARAARCYVEEGRIREAELGDQDGAFAAYRAGLEADPSFLDAFLAAVRVCQAKRDLPALVGLYSAEAKRTEGATAQFWYGRAARTSWAANSPPAETSALYREAMELSDGTSTSIHREAQAFSVSAGQDDAWFEALSLEAKIQDGSARATTLLQLGAAAGTTEAHRDRSIAQLLEAFGADAQCSPAAGLAVQLMIAAERPEQAIETLKDQAASAATDSDRARLAFRMGEIAEHNLSDFALAADHYRAAADLDSGHPFASVSEARAFAMGEDWASAANAYTVLARASSEPDRAARFWYQAAQIQRWHLKDTKAANQSDVNAYEASALQPASIQSIIDSAAKSGSAEAHAEALAQAASRLTSPADRLDSAYRSARIRGDVLQDAEGARALLHRCVEIDPHCQPVMELLRETSAVAGDWQAVYDIRRVEASASTGPVKLWHLIGAAQATAHIPGLDAQAVALEILDQDPQHPAGLAVMERSALRSRDQQRLIGVYRRTRNSIEDPAKRTAITVRLADLASELGDKQLAVRAITRILEASVGPRPYGAMGRMSVALENWGLAEAALHADGDQQGLARLLESTSDDHKRVASTWRSITKAKPDSGEAHGGLERALTRMSSRDGLAETHGALARCETDSTIANMHALLAGHLFEHEDNHGRAIEYYQFALKEQPYRGKAFEALVRIHCDNADVPAVHAVFQAASCTDQAALADALIDCGAPEEAARIYKTEAGLSKEGKPSIDSLAMLVRYEQTLAIADKWKDCFEVLTHRLELCATEKERSLVDGKRRWVLSERMADSDEAWEFYRQLHEDQPEDAEVLENLARIAGARGELLLAIQFLDGLSNIAATAEDAARYQRRVAEVHAANDDPGKARSAYLRALDHQPDDVDALSGLKAIATNEEDWQGLVGVLTRELQLQDGPTKQNTAREIAQIWETKLDDPAVAIDSWRKVLELAPGDQMALTHLVSQAEATKDWNSFIEDGQALVHYLEGADRADLLGRMGRVAIQHLQREDEAIRFLDAASTADPPNKQAAADLERIHAGRGSWDQVVECIVRRAKASEKDEAVSLYLQAAKTRKNQLRDRKGAAAIYNEVLNLNPNEINSLQFKGDYLFEHGDLPGAVDVFERIETLDLEVDLDDFDVQMEQALYYFHFGEALRRLDRKDDAVKRYEQALGLNGSHLPSLEAVGPMYVATERWSEANKVFRQVLQLTGGQGEPDRLARVYACLGMVEHAQGSTDKAVKRFDKALELKPNDVDALRGYASVLYERKDWNNLLTTYNNIIYHASERDAFVDAYLMKGYVLDVHMSLADKAAQHYEKSLSFDAAHPGALMRLAELALRKDDWDRALSYAGRALSVGDVKEPSVAANLHLIQAIGSIQTNKSADAEAALKALAGSAGEVPAATKAAGNDPVALHSILRERLQFQK